MSTFLIEIEPSQFKGGIKESINARTLWERLKSKSDFSPWIKNGLQDFGRNIDYISFHKKMEVNNASKIEYILTPDTAKHIAMLEHSKEGYK